MSYNLKAEEMETTINFDRSSPTASIYTADAVMIRKLDKLCGETPLVSLLKKDAYSAEYELPKSMVRIVKPRLLSDETRKKYSDGAKKNFAQAAENGSV